MQLSISDGPGCPFKTQKQQWYHGSDNGSLPGMLVKGELSQGCQELYLMPGIQGVAQILTLFQGDKKVWKIEKGQKKWGLAALAYSRSPHKVVCCFQGWEQRIMSAGLVSFLTLTIRVRVTGKSNTRLFVCREKLERQPTDCTAPVLSLQTSSSLFFHPWLLFSPLRHKLLYSP